MAEEKKSVSKDESGDKGVRHIDKKGFEALMKEKKPVLVDFFATWCGPCQMMKPIIEELANEEKDERFIVAELDGDNEPELLVKHNVMSFPTFGIFKDGKEVDRVMGAQTKEALVEKVEAHL